MNRPDSKGRSRLGEQVPAGFRRAMKKAEVYLNDKEKAAELLRKAREKALEKQGALAGVWQDLLTLFRLLKTWITGEYEGVTWQSILLVITAVLYFVMPFDVIPDFIAVFGFFDDAAIIAYIVSRLRQELDTFTEWEESIHKERNGDGGIDTNLQMLGTNGEQSEPYGQTKKTE